MSQRQEPIAIIGSACRFPGGSTSPSKLWDLLREPRDILRPVPPDRFSSKAYYHPDPAHDGTSNVETSYFLDEDISVFDHALFQIPPSEADVMDPQQRILLETVYDAMCDSGLTIESLRGSPTSVFVGQMSDDWNVLLNKDMEKVHTYTATGVARSITANRISYFFDWHGPSVTIDTACSSSLVAVHQAVQTLLSGESRVAVAAGSNLILSPVIYIAASNLRMLSPSGRCRMWDADADGYGRGEGVAAVFLKPLSAALEDGDHIEAVIRATGVNQDGRTPGLTVPSGKAQAELIRSTYARAGLDIMSPKERPQYFHAHGTGTAAGDTQEAEAIAMALFPDGNPSPTQEKLLVGSVKTIIGHTEGTAGLASLIASSQALQHVVIPPNMLFNRLNPRIEPFFEHLEVPTTAKPWPPVANGQPRRVSINSFGFGGTNVHVILESFEPAPGTAIASTPQIVPFVFSASSETSLLELLRCYSHFCQQNPNVQPRELAWTLHARRSVLPYRVAIPASSIADLSASLEDLLRATTSQSVLELSQRQSEKPQARVWGIFTGQGAQRSRMGARLVEASDLARGYIAHLDEILTKLPATDRPSWTLHEEILAASHNSRVSEASVAQPLCTAVQIILVKLLRLAGVKLHCVIGHSSGEIGAAYASGLISEDDAIRVAYYRGKFATLAQQEGKRGAMLAVHATLEEVEALSELEMFYGRVQMAAHNSPSAVVLSGDEEAIEEVAAFFRSRRKVVQRLKVDTAYHSHHMLPYAEPYTAALEGLKIRTPTDTCPAWYSSSLLPSVKMVEQNLTSRYWPTNMTSPVHFFETVAYILEAEGAPDIVLEFGPHPALRTAFTSSFKNVTGNQNTPPYLGLLSRGQDDVHQLSSTLGDIWRHLGAGSVDFDALDQTFSGDTGTKQMVTGLPQYPFDHSRSFGALSRVSSAHIHGHSPPHPLLGKRRFESETTHGVTWRNILRPTQIPWLSGHQLQGQLVFPATAYLAMAIESITLLAKDATIHLITLEDVAVERAIVFSDEEASVEMLFTVKFDRASNPAELTAEFACYSSLSNDTPMVRNVCGRMVAELDDRDTLEPLQHDIPKETYNLREVTADRFYASLAKLGYEYQSPFTGIRSIRRKLGYATGEIHDDGGNDKAGSGWEKEDQVLVHPGMMDSALKAIAAASSCPGDGLAYTMNVPTRIDRLVLDVTCARSRVTNKSSKVVEYTSLVRERMRGETVADVYLAIQDSPDAVLMQIEGVHIKSLSPSSAEEDEVMFSEFIYGPYELDSTVVQVDSMGGGAEVGGLADDRLAPWVWMAKLARQLSHRYPRMRILEVGAGGGEATQEIVSSLDSAFSSYTFTDTSSDKFNEARDRLKDHTNCLAFQSFDTQKSPTEQGLAERAFDLVIVAHTAGDQAVDAVEMTLKNIRQLLKPGGHCLLSVSTPNIRADHHGPTANEMALSQWSTHLQRHGFSVIDTLPPKPHDICSYNAMAAQAVDERINLLRNPLEHTERQVAGLETLIVIGGKTNQSRRLVEEVTTFLQPWYTRQLRLIDSVERLLDVDHDLSTGSSVLCVTDLDDPFLKDLTAAKLDALKHLFQHARNILWVCQGVRSHEPYSAMMFGLSRTIRAEYSNLNLQMLDIDTLDGNTASKLASIFLRLQIWDLWAREGSQDVENMVWSVERELVLEQGRILIPRLRPKTSSNLRYNAARRVVTEEIDPQEISIQLGCQTEASFPSTSLAMPVPREIPRLRVPSYPLSPTTTTARVTHSLFPFIRIDGIGSVMLFAGTDTSTNAAVFALSPSAESPAPTIRAWTVEQSGLKLGPADGLIALASSLVAQQILGCASSVPGTLVVHEAGAVLAQALRRGAQRRGLSLVLTSSMRTKDDVEGNMVHIHPKMSKSVVRRIIPRSTSMFIDLSTTRAGTEHSDTSSVIRSCLPQNCDILGRSRFYSPTVQILHQDSMNQQGKSVLQAAVEDVSSLTPTTPQSPVIVPLSKLANATEPHSCPIVLDWSEGSIPIELLPVDEGTIFRADKTYVLAGLAGELGQSLAEWMVQRGARNIVLSSRHPNVNPKFSESLSKEWGAVVKIMAFDVTNREEVHASLATIQNTMPPIAGIANGAMVLRDSTFETMTLADWQTCVQPKVDGTLLLDELFHTTPLDFFITFSSLAAVIGNMGQANYAAANAFLAALCAQRRNQRGVAGSTMDISSVVGLGVVERSGVVDAEYFAGLGFRNIAETDLHQLFAEAMIAGRPGSGEMPEIVTGIKPIFPEEDTRGNVASDPRFGHFIKERPDTTESGDGKHKHTSAAPVRSLLLKARTFRQAEQIIRDSFLAKLKRILRTDKIANDAPLFELGLDSLMAVEVRNWFSKELDVYVPVMRILSNGTIHDLVGFVTKKQKMVDVSRDDGGGLKNYYPFSAVAGEDALSPDSDMTAVSPSSLLTPTSEASAGVASPSSVDAIAHGIVAPGKEARKSTLQVLSDFSQVFPF